MKDLAKELRKVADTLANNFVRDLGTVLRETLTAKKAPQKTSQRPSKVVMKGASKRVDPRMLRGLKGVLKQEGVHHLLVLPGGKTYRSKRARDLYRYARQVGIQISKWKREGGYVVIHTG